MPDNLRVWNQFCKTPKEATKEFKKGGWHGTDINPAYRLRCLTELFGPQGTGWGWTIHERWRETWPSRVKVGERWEDYEAACAFVSLSLWYVDADGERRECSPQIGGTECDLAPDEVWKMSITDAIGKCCLALGIAADVYMGQFDGKYRDAPDRTAAPQEPPKPACPQCGKKVSVIKGKEEYGGGWLCWKKKEGCGHAWQDAPAEPPKTNGKPAGDPFEAAKSAVAKCEKERFGTLIDDIQRGTRSTPEQKEQLLELLAQRITNSLDDGNDQATVDGLLAKILVVRKEVTHTFA